MNQLQDRSKYFTRLFDAMTYQPLLSLITYEDIIARHMLFNDPDFCDKPRSQQL